MANKWETIKPLFKFHIKGCIREEFVQTSNGLPDKKDWKEN